MATRKATRKRSPSKKKGPSVAEILLRPGLIGSFLVLLAVFTALSLVAGSRGTITAAWIGWLRGAFGDGVWAVPVLTGVAGLALVFAAMDEKSAPQWRRPFGILLLFLALVVGMSLALPAETRRAVTAEGGAGGWLGTELANGLQRSISQVGAWAVVAFLLISGIVFLTDRLLLEASAGFGRWMREQNRRRAEPPVLTASRSSGGELHGLDGPARRAPFSGFFTGAGAIFAGARKGHGSADPMELLPPDDAPALPPRSLVRPIAPEAGAPPPSLRGAAAAAPATPAGRSAPLAEGQPVATPMPDILQPRIIGGTQEWKLPAVAQMLTDFERRSESDEYIRDQGKLIQETLALFGVPAEFEGAYKGPSVTQYLIRPGYVEKVVKGEPQKIKVKVARIAGLSNDLALALAAPSVRIEAPIPGTTYVGIEVPNRESNVVGLKELMESEGFLALKGRLKIALGEDVQGLAVSADLARMPHLLIAGATGSGKSVCINSIISCLLLTHTPETLRMLMVDPKMVELSVYNGVPHLLSPVVTEVDKAAGVLYWAVKEMERRYTIFGKVGARDLARYNETLTAQGDKPLPMIVIVIDEMADLMMAAPEEVEKHICRLAQMARATGIHLIIATQRPSVDVITGLIKANFPARIAFAVTSQIDSRVILDIPGAERLLGRGDMLYMSPDAGKLERLQGTWLSDDEINKIVRYWKGVRVFESQPVLWEQAPLPMEGAPQAGPRPPMGLAPGAAATPARQAPPMAPPVQGMEQPLFEQIEALKAVDDRDVLFDDALRVVREAGKGSVSLLQKKLRIGYGRASRLVDQLEEAGVLGPDQGGTAGRPLLGTMARSAAPAAPQPAPPPAGSSTGGVAPHIFGAEDEDEDEEGAPPAPAPPSSNLVSAKPATPPPPRPDVWM